MTGTKIINNKLVTSEKRKTLELKELLIAIQQVGMVSPFNFLSQVWFWRVVLFCLSSFPILSLCSLLFYDWLISCPDHLLRAWPIGSAEFRVALSLKPHGWMVKKRWKLAGNFRLSVFRRGKETFADAIWDYLLFVCGVQVCSSAEGCLGEQFEYAD